MKYAIVFITAVATTVVAAPAPTEKLPFYEIDVCLAPTEYCQGTAVYCARMPNPEACFAKREPDLKKKLPKKKLPFYEIGECLVLSEDCEGTAAYCARMPNPEACFAEREPDPKKKATADAKNDTEADPPAINDFMVFPDSN